MANQRPSSRLFDCGGDLVEGTGCAACSICAAQASVLFATGRAGMIKPPARRTPLAA